MFSSSSEDRMSRVHRRVIRRYFHGIGFPYVLVFVHLVYQMFPANGEESMNGLEMNYFIL